MEPTNEISSTPMLIFGNDQNVCLLDSIFLTNLTDNPIEVTLSLSREVEIGTETDFVIVNEMSLDAKGRIDVLQNTSLTLQPGDLLYAYSDFSENVFNAFISYRELTELSAENLTDPQNKIH
jgi:hypothetical protein